MSEAVSILEDLSKRHEDWRKEMVHLYDDGASDREVMRELGITPIQFEILYKDISSSDFRELAELGNVLAHAWWEAQGRKNLFNNKFNTQLYKFQMGNRYGWSEKTESSLTRLDFSNMDDQSLMREIEDLQKRLERRAATSV